ncbi:MAG: hypothetical protein JRI47_01330 [Deltaproteobacteria bacterium]|nr:hypothetical protein [Deltaproteobacteria bacterium]
MSVLITFFLLSMATIAYCIMAPRVYKSSTLILIEPQEIPADYVRSTVTTDAASRVNTLKQQVMSRPRLKEIIVRHDLFPKIRANRTMFDAVEAMREHISVEVQEANRGRDTAPASFEISYEGENPVNVREVTAAIAYIVIEDDLNLRERQAAGTSRFLEGELKRVLEKLREKEELVRQFKEKNLGLLPEQMENNYRILAQLQQNLDSINSSLQNTADRKVLLQGQLNRLHTLRSTTVQVGPQIPGSASDETPLSLGEIRQRLHQLRSRYSDKHPDVIRLTATIARLEKEDRSESSGDRTPPAGSSDTQRLMVIQREDLATQLELTAQETRGLEEEKKRTSRQIRKYRQRIENGPKVEQLFLDLRRDYEEATENYQSLLEKKLQAELAENLEKTQKGEQFRVLEPANLPQKPSKPNVLKVLGMGFMMALACGLGTAYLKERMDQTFWQSADLEAALDLPVLVTLPLVKIPSERNWTIYKNVMSIAFVASMAGVLLYALHFLWKTDPTVFPFL